VKASSTTSVSPAAALLPPTPSPAEPSPTPFAAPSAATYPRLPIPAGTARCHSPQLEVAFVTAGPAAGNLDYSFEMRNISATGCWVYGFVGFQTLDRGGRPLPQTINWSTHSFFGNSDSPSRILLPTGTTPLGSEPRTGHAFFNLATNDVLCDVFKDPVANIKIWPPNEHLAITIRAQSLNGLQFVFCGGFVLNPLEIQPYPTFG
jgi:uncharacterized protein DUF4232